MIAQAGIPCKWANDSQRFLLEHFDTIKKSPSHIYHSALPFCPSSSWLHRCYSAEFSQEVKVARGLPTGWGKCSRTVSFDSYTGRLSYWNNTIAAGYEDWDIIILDAVTGSQTATLSSHTDSVGCIVFSSDGRSLVSGSDDRTVKLWDVQTGGVVKTFSGHTDWISSVSISADSATVASASGDGSIRLWGSQMGECYCVIKQGGEIDYVQFSPTDPQYFLSVCDDKIWQWNINGLQAGPTYDGHCVAFSPDGTQFVVCNKESVTVQSSSSGVMITELHMGNDAIPKICCFSPDGKLVAVSDQNFIHIWDVTSSDPHLIESFHRGVGIISTLLFSSPSSLISVIQHKFIQLWQIGSPSMDLAERDPESTSLISAGGKLIALQAKDGMIITSEMEALKVWDTSTNLCKTSFQIPPREVSYAPSPEHAQMINGRLIFTWYEDKTISLWDVEEGELLWTVNVHSDVYDIKISQDGSRVFCLFEEFLQALSAETGKVLGQVKVKDRQFRFGYLSVDGFVVWVCYYNSEYQGWSFGISDPSPVRLLDVFPYQCYLNSSLRWDSSLYGIKNEATGKVAFLVPEKYGYVLMYNGMNTA